LAASSLALALTLIRVPSQRLRVLNTGSRRPLIYRGALLSTDRHKCRLQACDRLTMLLGSESAVRKQKYSLSPPVTADLSVQSIHWSKLADLLSRSAETPPLYIFRWEKPPAYPRHYGMEAACSMRSARSMPTMPSAPTLPAT